MSTEEPNPTLEDVLNEMREQVDELQSAPLAHPNLTIAANLERWIERLKNLSWQGILRGALEDIGKDEVLYLIGEPHDKEEWMVGRG